MPTVVYVYTMSRAGQIGAWSRYELPFMVSAFTRRGDKSIVRAGNDIIEFDDSLVFDFTGDPRQAGFPGVVWWPWLDFGSPGVTKMMHGFDIVGWGTSEIEIGYDQTAQTTFTTPYEIPADTAPGQPIAMPVSAPSFSVRLTYQPGQAWQFHALNLYLDDTSI